MAEAQRLIEAIEPWTIASLRDRAIIGLLGHAWASVDAVIAMRVTDYYWSGGRRWVRLTDAGSERRELVDRKLELLIDQYMAAARIEEYSTRLLFRSIIPGNGNLSARPITQQHILNMIKKYTNKIAANFKHHRSTAYGFDSCQLEQLIADIETVTTADRRDRAIIGLMLYTSASSRTISLMRARDYYVQTNQYWVRLNRRHSILAKPPLIALMREYLAAFLSKDDDTSPLFSTEHKRSMTAADVREMIQRRGRVIGARSRHARKRTPTLPAPI